MAFLHNLPDMDMAIVTGLLRRWKEIKENGRTNDIRPAVLFSQHTL